MVFPYRIISDGKIEYAIFNRSDSVEDFWQAISGGGEDDETPLEAARREAWEEAGISRDAPFLSLDSMATVPAIHFDCREVWGEDVYVITEYSFGVRVEDEALKLSHEHTEYRWLGYEGAKKLLKFDSNRNALWELDQRLHRMMKEKT
ncbi:MAG: NUDIX pyrophosphatase [Candidatus Latescibacteria bacterium]|nr:NUDIX pyrophosphatase [Candidatus Latescibacterota bacterium]